MIGVISDTHGLLRPQALAALAGAELILHAGDVGRPEVLTQLREIAPTVAVRGNVDTDAWARDLPEVQLVDTSVGRIYMTHQRDAVHLDPSQPISVVITGHSHRPHAEWIDGVLFLNPGAAGPRRFSLPITVARLTRVNERLSHEIVSLDVR